MKWKLLSVFLLLTLSSKLTLSSSVSGSNSLVVSTTESAKELDNSKHDDTSYINPQIYAMDIRTNISNRFATTLITSKVKNLEQKAAETTFSVILPENAFISEFVMEIDGKIYKAYVKEKEEAKQIYNEAVSRGQSAGHVELDARDSKTFTVSVNIEPESKTIFRLIYEELLQRQLGQYELVVNIHPGQIVDDLNVEVQIRESRPLTFVQTPALRTGNEISKTDDDKLKPSADIEIINATSASVRFKPDKSQQKNFAELLGSEKESGLAGQFIVQYDVERDPQGGEVLVRDGYFVHFFSPSELESLKKYVVFVLDYSGSMIGRKIEQLTEAMQHILPELNKNDLFSIVRFSTVASVWNVAKNEFTRVYFNTRDYERLRSQLSELNLPEGVEATRENIEKAKNITPIKDYGDMSATNIIAGLEVGLFLLKRTQEKFPKQYQPMIIFLTDGDPNVDMYSGDEITETVNKINSGENRASIFSLSFGIGADKSFLQKLSSKNLGFSRHIFEASDASLQLQDFYSKISSPLLSNVTFKYVDGVTDVTKTHYPILFNGSELVVAGKTDDNPNISLHVHGICHRGPIDFKPTRVEPVSSLERLWAYLTVKQILKERKTATNKTELTKEALELALKYSFVTSVSSLVVVKPNRTDDVDSKLTAPDENRPWSNVPMSGLMAPTGPSPSGTYISGIKGMPAVSYNLIGPGSGGLIPDSAYSSRPTYPSYQQPPVPTWGGAPGLPSSGASYPQPPAPSWETAPGSKPSGVSYPQQYAPNWGTAPGLPSTGASYPQASAPTGWAPGLPSPGASYPQVSAPTRWAPSGLPSPGASYPQTSAPTGWVPGLPSPGASYPQPPAPTWKGPGLQPSGGPYPQPPAPTWGAPRPQPSRGPYLQPPAPTWGAPGLQPPGGPSAQPPAPTWAAAPGRQPIRPYPQPLVPTWRTPGVQPPGGYYSQPPAPTWGTAPGRQPPGASYPQPTVPSWGAAPGRFPPGGSYPQPPAPSWGAAPGLQPPGGSYPQPPAPTWRAPGLQPPGASYPQPPAPTWRAPGLQPPRAPQWLEDIKNSNQRIATLQGSFKLGKSGEVNLQPECYKTPLNGTGTCTLLFDCPQVFSILTDIYVYLQYFCPLNEYAGVCCPKKINVQ